MFSICLSCFSISSFQYWLVVLLFSCRAFYELCWLVALVCHSLPVSNHPLVHSPVLPLYHLVSHPLVFLCSVFLFACYFCLCLISSGSLAFILFLARSSASLWAAPFVNILLIMKFVGSFIFWHPVVGSTLSPEAWQTRSIQAQWHNYILPRFIDHTKKENAVIKHEDSHIIFHLWHPGVRL